MTDFFIFLVQIIMINLMMIVFHELGHYAMIKNLKIKKYKPFFLGIRFESSDDEAKKVLLSGILAGFIPLIFMGMWGGVHEFVILVLLLAYLIPCWSDVQHIRAKGGIRWD